jgi:hypothetical protein
MNDRHGTPRDADPPARGPEAAEALRAAREGMERALDAALDEALDAARAGPADATPDATPDATRAEPPEPASVADVVIDHIEAAGVLAPDAAEPLRGPLAERLRTAETAVEMRQRAARALDWALLAQRRRAWDADGRAPDDGRTPDGAPPA